MVEFVKLFVISYNFRNQVKGEKENHIYVEHFYLKMCLWGVLSLHTVLLLLPSMSFQESNSVHYLGHGDIFHCNKSLQPKLHIFCYIGNPKYIIHIWQSVVLQVDHPTNEYTRYEGHNPEVVRNDYLDHRGGWMLNIFLPRQNNIKLNPFNTSCVGILTQEEYFVYLNIIRIDFWKLLLLITGILIFLSAERLSKNSTFHYFCGVAFGICTSFLIVIYFISKLFPKKPFMYGVIGCGWTIVIYVLQVLWDNLRTMLSEYVQYVVWYTIVAGLISFILSYRWGPVENQRTINLIKWSLQFIGLTTVFYSSHYREAAVGQIVILLISYKLPKTWINAPITYWKKSFPPKVSLLTNDQYYEQGVRATAKALEELRTYCSSPKCNPWMTALKIKDVKRFASFVEGNSHLSDEEVLEYEVSVNGEVTDDENDQYPGYSEEL